MHWLIQRGFDNDKYYRKLVETLEKLEVTHSFCTVIPFSDHNEGLILETELPEDVPVFSYGSYSLSKHAIRRGLVPGAYISNDSALHNLIKHYGDNMLNSDMVVTTIGSDVSPDWENMFIKPSEDTKAFTAEIMSRDNFLRFRENILRIEGYSSITKNTTIIIASPKTIHAEYRFFVVRGRVVTYSQYAIGDRVVYSPNVDEYIINFAQKMVGIYEPDDAFVIDIALTEEGLKVIEVNCINSSGLYEIDLQKLIMAVDGLDRPYVRNSFLAYSQG